MNPIYLYFIFFNREQQQRISGHSYIYYINFVLYIEIENRNSNNKSNSVSEILLKCFKIVSKIRQLAEIELL